MADQKTFNLSKKNKQRFEEMASRLTREDIVKAKSKLGKKIEDIEDWVKNHDLVPDFIPEFLENLKIISEIVSDDQFKLARLPLLYLGFALVYVISPFDLIPDAIPGVGYLDDALVVSWIIKELCADEVKRYKSYLKTKRAREEGGHLVPLVEKSKNEHVVIVTGFCSEPTKVTSFSNWLTNITYKMPSASVSAFIWDTKDISDFLEVLCKFSGKKDCKNPREVLLKVGYTLAKAISIWSDGKANAESYSSVLAKDLANLQSQPGAKKQITLIGHSLGARLIHHSFDDLEKGLVSRVCAVGGAVAIGSNWNTCVRKVDSLYNFFSANDYVLKFLYRFMERGESPIGLNRIGKSDTSKRKEFDLTPHISGHTEYGGNLNLCLDRFRI